MLPSEYTQNRRRHPIEPHRSAKSTRQSACRRQPASQYRVQPGPRPALSPTLKREPKGEPIAMAKPTINLKGDAASSANLNGNEAQELMDQLGALLEGMDYPLV